MYFIKILREIIHRKSRYGASLEAEPCVPWGVARGGMKKTSERDREYH